MIKGIEKRGKEKKKWERWWVVKQQTRQQIP
jgi:hypothetical protein